MKRASAGSAECITVNLELQQNFVHAMDDARARLNLSREAYIQVAVTAAMIKAGHLRIINDDGSGDVEVEVVHAH